MRTRWYGWVCYFKTTGDPQHAEVRMISSDESRGTVEAYMHLKYRNPYHCNSYGLEFIVTTVPNIKLIREYFCR